MTKVTGLGLFFNVGYEFVCVCGGGGSLGVVSRLDAQTFEAAKDDSSPQVSSSHIQTNQTFISW